MSSENKEYSIERLSKTNLVDVEKLHQAVYGNAAPADFFSNKYDTAYTGVEFTGFIAYNNNQFPVAYYGVIPCFIQYGDKIILAAQSADTMTHPKHRYKGMFVELSNICFELCRHIGIQIIFGFPNQNSFHGAIHKLGWQMTETMDCFSMPVNAIPWEMFSRQFSFLKGVYSKYIQLTLQKYLLTPTGITNSVISADYGGIYRDQDYLKYKTYFTRHVIRIGLTSFWIKINNGLIIGDIEGVTDDFDEVLNKLKKLARKLGVSQIQFHSSPHTQLHRLFAERYKAVPSFPVLFQDFESGIPIDKIKFTLADIDIF